MKMPEYLLVDYEKRLENLEQVVGLLCQNVQQQRNAFAQWEKAFNRFCTRLDDLREEESVPQYETRFANNEAEMKKLELQGFSFSDVDRHRDEFWDSTRIIMTRLKKAGGLHAKKKDR